MSNALNNWEIAVLVWTAGPLVLLSPLLLAPNVRSKVRGLGSTLANADGIIVSLTYYVVFVAIFFVGLGYTAGLWTPNMTKDTVVWALGPAGLVGLWKVADPDRKAPVWQIVPIAGVLNGTLALITEFCIFALPLHIVIVGAVSVLSLLSTLVAGGLAPPLRPAKPYMDRGLWLVGLVILVCGLVGLFEEWATEGFRAVGVELALPLSLAVFVLPFAYSLGWWLAFEAVRSNIDKWSGSSSDAWSRRRAKLATLLALHLREPALRRVGTKPAQAAGRADTFLEAWRIMRRAGRPEAA